VKLKGQLNVKDLFSEERFKAQAAAWGAGARYVSSEPLTQGDMQGAKAVYAFDNINGLVMGKQRSDRPEPQMLFSMQKPSSGSSLLTIEFPRGAAKDLPAGDAGAPARTMSEVPPEAIAMMKSMLAGARLGVELEVDGRVIKTNAPASSGSGVTLVDIDIAALMADPKHLEAMQLLRPGTDFETVRQALKDVPGIKIPTDPKVTVEFAR
jgi:hypothetical protein